MKVYIFVTPGMAEEKTTFILASSKKEAIKIYCDKYNDSKVIAEKRLKKKIEKSRIFYEYLT